MLLNCITTGDIFAPAREMQINFLVLTAINKAVDAEEAEQILRLII